MGSAMFMGSLFFVLEIPEVEHVRLSESIAEVRGALKIFLKIREVVEQEQTYEFDLDYLTWHPMSSSSQNAYYEHCQWCFQKCTCHGGGLANHMWWSISCQRKLMEAHTQIQQSQNSSTPNMEFTPAGTSAQSELV